MNEDIPEIDTEDSLHCPNHGCPYILFIAHDEDDGEWYCMECSEVFYEEEI